MGYNARNDEIRDNVTRMRREWEAQRNALATVRQFNATLSAKGYVWFWPKIAAALTSKHHWLVINCDSCRRPRPSCSSAPCSPATGRSPTPATCAPAARPPASSPPTCPGSSSAACAACPSSNAPDRAVPRCGRGAPTRTVTGRVPSTLAARRRSRAPDPAPAAARSRPSIAPELVPAARRHRHGRQRPLGQGARAAAHRGPRGAARRACSTSSHGAIELGVEAISAYAFSTENWKRSPGRGALPHGLQPRRDPPPPRRDARARRAGALGRPPAAAVEVGRSTSSRRPSELTARQHRADPDDVRQLRRPRRDRRRRRGDRARGRGGPARPGKVDERTIARYLDEPDMPDVDLFVRSSGEQRTSNFLLWQSAYAELVFLDTLWPDFDRRAPVAGLRAVRLARPPLRRRGAQLRRRPGRSTT